MNSRRPASWLAALCLLLGACASEPPPAPPPGDPALESGWRLARFAFRDGHYDQAARLYERTLARAFARDDAKAIGDIGYEYALALLRAGEAGRAADEAIRTRAELQRRGQDAFAALDLVEAVARYETGEPDRARAAATAALQRADRDDAQTVARAQYLLGMLAADARDLPGLRAAAGAMGQPTAPALQADLAELRAREAWLAGDPGAAVGAFDRLAAARRELRDDVGVARALAQAGGAAAQVNDVPAAADFYFRAGRSAAVQRDPARARRWLQRALDLAERNNLANIAADARRLLAQVESDSRRGR